MAREDLQEYLRRQGHIEPVQHDRDSYSALNLATRNARTRIRLVHSSNATRRDALTELRKEYVFKRFSDVTISIISLIFFGPLMLIVAVGIILFDPGPVFFRQERVGQAGRTFKVLKFRTMCTNADALLAELLSSNPASLAEWETRQKLSCDPRVNAFGRFLRKSSFDELPQLFNVLAGDMSIVGPRPVVPSECARYGKYLKDYLSVRPGVTGLWQVMGRNNTSYRRRVALDVLYSRRSRPLLDFHIMLLTIPAVISAEGAS